MKEYQNMHEMEIAGYNKRKGTKPILYVRIQKENVKLGDKPSFAGKFAELFTFSTIYPVFI